METDIQDQYKPVDLKKTFDVMVGDGSFDQGVHEEVPNMDFDKEFKYNRHELKKQRDQLKKQSDQQYERDNVIDYGRSPQAVESEFDTSNDYDVDNDFDVSEIEPDEYITDVADESIIRDSETAFENGEIDRLSTDVEVNIDKDFDASEIEPDEYITDVADESITRDYEAALENGEIDKLVADIEGVQVKRDVSTTEERFSVYRDACVETVESSEVEADDINLSLDSEDEFQA